jgi:hypothetical protein
MQIDLHTHLTQFLLDRQCPVAFFMRETKHAFNFCRPVAVSGKRRERWEKIRTVSSVKRETDANFLFDRLAVETRFLGPSLKIAAAIFKCPKYFFICLR